MLRSPAACFPVPTPLRKVTIQYRTGVAPTFDLRSLPKEAQANRSAVDFKNQLADTVDAHPIIAQPPADHDPTVRTLAYRSPASLLSALKAFRFPSPVLPAHNTEPMRLYLPARGSVHSSYVAAAGYCRNPPSHSAAGSDRVGPVPGIYGSISSDRGAYARDVGLRSATIFSSTVLATTRRHSPKPRLYTSYRVINHGMNPTA